MTSLETQGFARFEQPGSKGDSATSGSRTWRLLIVVATILAILSLSHLVGPGGGDATPVSAQGERPMTGWGKWGGYTE